MSDLGLILCFLSMLFVPCFVAYQTARSRKEAVPSQAGLETSYFNRAAAFPAMTNAELTAKRNRERYLQGLTR